MNHYSFHMWDTEWGAYHHLRWPVIHRLVLGSSSTATSMLPAERRKAGLNFSTEGKCFTQITELAGLARIAETLPNKRTIERLSQVCERWIYSICCVSGWILRARTRRLALRLLDPPGGVRSKPSFRARLPAGAGLSAYG
jgi:hypothetical protein